MSKHTPQRTKDQAVLAAALDDAYSVAKSDGFVHCSDLDPHDPANCDWCALREARSAYLAAARAPVLARLEALQSFVFEDCGAPITPTTIINSRRRKLYAARAAFEQAVESGTAREQVDAGVALELAEGEFEILYAKYVVYDIECGIWQAIPDVVRRGKLERAERKPGWEWRNAYITREAMIWRGAWRRHLLRDEDLWTHDAFETLARLNPKRRGLEILTKAKELRSNQGFCNWLKKQYEVAS